MGKVQKPSDYETVTAFSNNTFQSAVTAGSKEKVTTASA
jgi:hypothetical protein